MWASLPWDERASSTGRLGHGVGPVRVVVATPAAAYLRCRSWRLLEGARRTSTGLPRADVARRHGPVRPLRPYPDDMKPSALAALLLVASPLVVGCSDGQSCDDVDSLTEQLQDTQPDDPEFNDLTEKLQRAEADCNSH